MPAMLEPLDVTRQRQLTKLADDALRLIQDGEQPTDAVVKVCRDARVTAAEIERLCHAVNVGHTVRELKAAHRGEGPDFPLADPTEVFRQLYAVPAPPPLNDGPAIVCGKREKVASATTLTFTPTEVKTAFESRHWLDELREVQWHVKVAQDEVRMATERLNREVARLADQCRSAVTPFDVLYVKAASLPGGQEMLTLAGNLLGFDPSTIRQPYPINVVYDGPLPVAATVRRGVELAAKLAEAETTLTQMMEKAAIAQSYVNELRQTAQAGVKRAGFFSTLATGISSADEPAKTAPSPEKDKMWSLLYDPVQLAEIHGVQSLAALHDVMTNDEFLAEQDPKTVTEAYNSIVQVVPELADKPIVLRSVIRRAIQQGGVLEPFEVEQLAKIMKTRSSVDPESRLQELNVRHLM